jgi:hypothetical protein
VTSHSINGVGGEGSVVDPDPDGSASFWKLGSASGFASNKNPELDRHPDTHQSNKLAPEPDQDQFAEKPKMYGT